MNDVPHHRSLKSCKLKQQQDAVTYLLKWPKSRTVTIPIAGEDMEQQTLSFIALGIQNVTASLEDSLSVSYKSKHSLTMWSRNQALGISPKELKTYVHTKKRGTQMFIVTIFTIVKVRSNRDILQQVNGSVDSGVSIINRNELSSHEIYGGNK